ncbi:MAG TPA: hypothetical protein VLG47_00395 [Candidatus Saccharimonadales bacterium]|nr:hypothetical protein [Candidatus Saccharimonadales bacterium]
MILKSRLAGSWNRAAVTNRRVLTIAILLPVFLVSGFAGVTLRQHPHALASPPGQNYQICGANAATYLTSPYTYHSLASGTQDYTVTQYQALLTGGASLPPLPSYISAQGGSAPAARIYAPGATTSVPAYDNPETPIIHFFEGGNYGLLAEDSVSGDEFIGGSTTGFPEPKFDSANGAGGINSQNGSFYYSGGTSTLASSVSAGATTITTTTAIPGYIVWFTFADGTSYQIASNTGTSITLNSPITSAESSGQQVWANSTKPIAKLSTSYAQGATNLTLTGNTTIPIIQWQQVNIGDHSYNVTAVSGTQAGGYTITIGGLDIAGAANTPVYYSDLAGGVTVSYLEIVHDSHNTTGTIYTGVGWTVTHNNIHDGYMDNTGTPTPGLGVAFYGGDQGTIEYNCFSKMGDYAANVFGTNAKFDYNEIYESNYLPDPGCGCSGGGKWWGSLNADINNNAWINNGIGDGGTAIWLDNGNTGTDISGNYFDKTMGHAISAETGFNLNITNNLFQDDNWQSGSGPGDSNNVGDVGMNSSGGFNVPNSRYNNQVNITGNTFSNDWGGIGVWESGARNCLNSGETYGNGYDSPYCTGGFPNSANNNVAGQYYFSHIADTNHGGATYQLAQNASVGATTVLVNGSVATNDQIGFADPIQTSTTSTTNVTTLNGSQAINAATTTGFPSSGQLRVQTNALGAGDSSPTGAVLSYTGKTATSFTGVSFVRGKGSLNGWVEQVEPYKATSETCYANDCKVTITPALTSSVTAGNDIANTGTCQLFATAGATPATPLAPDSSSYYDGCRWGTAHITVTGNDFIFNPGYISAGTSLDGHAVGANCSAAHANNCGSNFMAYQMGGDPPYDNMIPGNAMMSNSNTTACPSWDSGCTVNPIKNLNALSAPPNYPPGGISANAEAPSNNNWYGNTYTGSWQWFLDWYGTCGDLPHDPTTNKSMPAGACLVDLSHFQSDWQQESGTTPAPSVNVSAAPPTITSGQSSTITWSSSGATSCSATAPAGFSISGTSGSTSVSPTSTTTYTISCTGAGGSNSAGTTVTVGSATKIGDFNNDNNVNITDLSMLLTAYGSNNATILTNMNRSGTVDITCLSIFLTHWGT